MEPIGLVEFRKEIRKRGEKNVWACAAALALHNSRMARWECVWECVCLTDFPDIEQSHIALGPINIHNHMYLYIQYKKCCWRGRPVNYSPSRTSFCWGKGRQGLQICWHRDNCETAWEPFCVLMISRVAADKANGQDANECSRLHLQCHQSVSQWGFQHICGGSVANHRIRCTGSSRTACAAHL